MHIISVYNQHVFNKMLNRTCRLNNKIQRVLMSDINKKHLHKNLAVTEITIVKILVYILHPFFVLSEKLSGSKFSTRSMILDSVKILYNTIKPQNSDIDMQKEIKKAFKDQLDVYFKLFSI